MGEIERIHPIRPATAPIATHRVEPGSDQRQHRRERAHDELELSNTAQEAETPVEEPEPVTVEPDHGLDLSI